MPMTWMIFCLALVPHTTAFALDLYEERARIDARINDACGAWTGDPAQSCAQAQDCPPGTVASDFPCLCKSRNVPAGITSEPEPICLKRLPLDSGGNPIQLDQITACGSAMVMPGTLSDLLGGYGYGHDGGFRRYLYSYRYFKGVQDGSIDPASTTPGNAWCGSDSAWDFFTDRDFRP